MTKSGQLRVLWLFMPPHRSTLWLEALWFCSDCWQITSLRQTVCTVICKWPDRICVSKYHQHICIGCCGNSVGVSNYVRWWRGFPTWKKWRSIISPLQTIALLRRIRQTRRRRRLVYVVMFRAVAMAGFTVQREIWFKQPEHPDWEASVKIRLESHFKPPPNVAWNAFHVFILLSIVSKINLSTPKTGFGLAVWIKP